MDFLSAVFRCVFPCFNSAKRKTRYVDPYDPEGGETDGARKPNKQVQRELKIAFLAVQAYIGKHEKLVRKVLEEKQREKPKGDAPLDDQEQESEKPVEKAPELQKPGDLEEKKLLKTVLEKETESFCLEIYEQFEKEEIVPLEDIFLSESWEANALVAKQKYMEYTKQAENNLTDLPREYLGKVVGLLESYNKLEEEYQKSLDDVTEDRRKNSVNYEVRIETLSKELESLEMDNWNENHVNLTQILALEEKQKSK